MHVLVEMTPLDPVTGTRVMLRAASRQDRSITGLNGVSWIPAIGAEQMPVLTLPLFQGDFEEGQDVAPGSCSFSAQINALVSQNANATRFNWAGAAVKVYGGYSGQAWPWTQIFEGKVRTYGAKKNTLSLSADVNREPFEKKVLTALYAGTGGAEGGADLKNKPKPLCIGRCRNLEPVLINVVDNIYQFHAYGPVNAVTQLYERGGIKDGFAADYATYAALQAATLPNAGWATCLAQGMIRLGAPSYGVITADIDGDKPSAWLSKSGEILSRLAAIAGTPSGNIDSASLTALDATVATLTSGGGIIGLYLTEQTTVYDVAKRIAKPLNSVAGISFLGKLFVCRVVMGAPQFTIDVAGKQKIIIGGTEYGAVYDSAEETTGAPFKRIEFTARRSWRVHSYDEIATYATIVQRGDYAAGTIYREGNIVQNQGASWYYINTVDGSGNAPPTLPTTSNAYWTIFADSGADGASAFNLVNINGTIISPGQVTKTDADGWTAKARTAEFYQTASVSGVTNGTVMVGLTTDPNASNSIDTIDYAVYRNGANVQVYRDGSPVSPVYTGGSDTARGGPVSDGVTVRYYYGGIALPYSHPVNTPGEVLYGVFSLFNAGATINDISFSAAGSAGANLFTLANTSNTVITQNSITSPAANGGFAASARSIEAFTGNVRVSAKLNSALSASIYGAIGLSPTPLVNAAGAFGAGYRVYWQDDQDRFYAQSWSGTADVLVAGPTGLTNDKVGSVRRQGTSIFFAIDGVDFHEITGADPSVPLYLSSRQQGAGSQFSNITIGQIGADGAKGSSIAEIRVWKQSATTPATPTGGTYNFATKTLTPPSGWGINPSGSGTDPWYSAVATFASIDPAATAVAPSGAWSSPGLQFASGADGQSNDVIYKRATSIPATPSPSATAPSGWYNFPQDVPAGAGAIYASPGERVSLGANYVWAGAYKIEGTDGLNAKAISLSTTGKVFPYNASGTAVATTINFRATRQDGTVTSAANTATALAATPYFTYVSDDEVSMSHAEYAQILADGGGTNYEQFSVETYFVDGATYSDTETISIAREGTPVGSLTNANHSLPADVDGNITSYAGASGEFIVQNGNAIISSSFTLSFIANPQNLTIGFAGNTYQVTGGFDAGEPNAYVTIRATGTGVWAGRTFDQVFSLGKNKTGAVGDTGAAGYSSATVKIYKRSAAAPPLPTTTSTFTFASGALTGQNNGWTIAVQADDGNPLWVTVASASSQTATDTIAAGEWVSPVIDVQSGSTGPSGNNSGTAKIFQRTATASAPALPSVTTTHTFATGVTAGLDNGWTSDLPASGGAYRWRAQAGVLAPGATDSILASEWAAAQLISQDGATGNSSAQVILWKRSATTPPVPSTTATYTFATGVLTGHNNGWTQAVPATDGNPLYSIVAPAGGTAATFSVVAGAWSSPLLSVMDGAAAITIAPTGAAYTIQCSAGGVPNTGEFNKVISFVVTQGGTDLSNDAATTYTRVSPDATADFGGTNGKVLTISDMSAENATVTVSIFRSAMLVGTVIITLNKASAGAAAGTVTDTSFNANNNTAGYVSSDVGGPLSIVCGASGSIVMSVVHNYQVPSLTAAGVCQMAGQILWRIAGGSFSGTGSAEEVDPSGSEGGNPGEPGSPSSLQFSRTISGLTVGATYEAVYRNKRVFGTVNMVTRTTGTKMTLAS
jgi:hypothetical protein